MNCYPDVLDVIEAAKDEFYGELMPNEEALADLENICALMDGFATGVEAEFIDVEVNEANGLLILSIEIPDIVLKDDGYGFYELVSHISQFEFRKIKGEMVRFCAYLDNLWVAV